MSNSLANESAGWYDRALAYYRAGDYARSRDCTKEALAADPDNVPCLILHGMALVEFGRPEDAVEPLQRATKVTPDNADAWRQLGIVLLTARGPTEALQAFEKALLLRPQDVSVLTDVGNLLFMLGRPEEALAALEQARRLGSRDVTILRNLAEMYTSLMRDEEALRTTREILELRPDDVLAHCDAAWLCLLLGRLDEAADVFRTLRRTDQEHEVHAIHGLVMIEIRRRDWRRAIDFVIEATRLDRYDLTTSFLIYISNKLFGRGSLAELPLNDLVARFDTEQREHRRLHAEIQA